MIIKEDINDEVVQTAEETDNNPYHIFDNAFLSACSWDKRLLIPLINEIFNKNIAEDAPIEHSSNELFNHRKAEGNERLIKRITDALVRVDGGKYHFECESKNDGEILIRISDYDMQIALNDARYTNHVVEVELPQTAVVYLRNHNTVPQKGKIIYRNGDDKLVQDIQYFEVGKYDLDYLSKKHLYILFPFYLMRYEHALKHNTTSKYKLIEKEANRVYIILKESYDDGIITKTEFEHVVTLCNDVVKEISKNNELNGKLVEIMGTEVLKTAEERGAEKGVFKATLENIKNAMESFKLSFDEACDGLKIKDREQYRKLV